MTPDPFSRRRFLAGVGQGTLIATIGPALAAELGLAPRSLAADGPGRLDFGELEPLVAWMQETAPDQLQAGLAAKLREGIELKRLVAAGALANARTFGGEDYIGFHTFMALSPALNMAGLLPDKESALPVFKVLYRNSNQIAKHGGIASEVLHPVLPAENASLDPSDLVAAVRAKNSDAAERLFAAMVRQDESAAFDALLESVREGIEVHRTVLPSRAWEMRALVGEAHGQVLLRQSLRYCLNAERSRRADWEEPGKVLSAAMEKHGLLAKDAGTKDAEDAFVESLAKGIFGSSPAEAADAVAAALAEGYRPEVIGEALSLAANQIVMRDPGRIPEWEFAGKPTGSVHGDSVGVHASDSAHAWRQLAKAGTGKNAHACLILGAWQVARDRAAYPGDALLSAKPAPSARQVGTITESDEKALLGRLDEAVRGRLQSHAAAIVQRWGDLKLPERPVFDCLLRYAVSEDGALHAEKYFQTVWDDFHLTRPAFRWRHLAGLARVTASEYGYPAPGREEARELLGA